MVFFSFIGGCSHSWLVSLIWYAGSLILRRCLSFGMLVLSFYGGVSHLACWLSHSAGVSLIWHVGSLILRRCLSFGMWVLSFCGGFSHLACGFSHSTAVSLIWHVGSLIYIPIKKRQENNPCLFSIIKLNAARAERKASCQNICELFAF